MLVASLCHIGDIAVLLSCVVNITKQDGWTMDLAILHGLSNMTWINLNSMITIVKFNSSASYTIHSKSLGGLMLGKSA